VPSIAIGGGRAGDDGASPVDPRAIPHLGVALAAAGAVLCAITATLTASGSTSQDAWLEALARATAVGAPIAVGIYAWRRPPFRRFGVSLVATGAVVFLATLAEASSPEVHAVGRISGWVLEPLLIYLILAFPSGRLSGRVDRALMWSLVLLAVTLFFPTALLVERYPEPSTWTSCHGGCPDNPFMVTASEPALVTDLVRPLREVVLILLLAAVTMRVALRVRRASNLLRRTLAPVLGVAAFRLVCFVGLLGLRRADADSALIPVWIWSLSLGVPLLAATFLIGLARWRLFIASAMQRLATRLAGHPQPEDLRAALADAFDDPSLEIVYWLEDGAGWRDARGLPVQVPGAGSGRCLTEIRDGDQRVSGIVHDEVLRAERAFIDTATAYAVMTFENHRLSAETAHLIAEVQDSRARIQATADDERRRIERDLHDGAQQRLVALRIKLELAAERIDGTSGADLFRQLGTDVDGALDEVRSLARGIYPAPLADWGLIEGLRSAARQAALPTTVLATGLRDRYPREIESAAYFCCLEAMQNAGKHARGATVVVIDLTADGALRFEVRDDGAGFDVRAARAGVGLTSMHDRVAAVAGELTVVSAPGRGTRVVGRIPLDARSDHGSDGSEPVG
jgi:signal transduction histidine kinase